MRKPIYTTGDDFIHPDIDLHSDRRIVFFSGLGLPLREQGEPFIRRFSLLNHISYMALDFDAITEGKSSKEDFGLETAFDRAMDKLSKLKEERLIFMGPCFGGLMAYRAAQEFPKRTEALLMSSPLVDFNNGALPEHISNYLMHREERLKKRGIPSESIRKMVHFRERVVCGAQKYGQLKTDSSYQGPISILHGQRDRFIPIENSRNIATALDRSNVFFTEVEHGGHAFDMEQDRRMCHSISWLKNSLSR